MSIEAPRLAPYRAPSPWPWPGELAWCPPTFTPLESPWDFNCELRERSEDWKTNTLRTFVVQPGIQVPIAELAWRYERFLHIAPDVLVPTWSRPPEPFAPDWIYLAQVHLGYHVAGYGFLVVSEQGMVRSAQGRVMPGLPPSLPRPMSQVAALDLAIRLLKLDGPPPWTRPSADPALHPPVATLSLAASTFDPGPDDFRLIWNVSFLRTGIVDPLAISLDAATGQVRRIEPGFVQ